MYFGMWISYLAATLNAPAVATGLTSSPAARR
jgi:hypothetical protein